MNNRISSLYCVFCDRHIKDVETIVSIGRSQIELGCLKRNDEDKVEYQEHDVIEELDLLYINTSGSYLDNNKRYYVFCKQCKLFVIKNFSQYNTHYDVDDFNRFYSNITLDVIKNIYHIYKQENKIEELKTFVKNNDQYINDTIDELKNSFEDMENQQFTINKNVKSYRDENIKMLTMIQEYQSELTCIKTQLKHQERENNKTRILINFTVMFIMVVILGKIDFYT